MAKPDKPDKSQAAPAAKGPGSKPGSAPGKVL